MKPICVRCQRFYRPKKTGLAFIEAMPKQNKAEPGTSQPELWKPYKLWRGDLWECQGCGHQAISGVGWAPVSEHYLPEFTDKCTAYNAEIQINDC